MDIELVAVLVGTIMAVLSGIGAAVAWWRSNLSKAAKADAEAARDRADRQLSAVEEQARAARESADAAGDQLAHLQQLVAAQEAQGREVARIAESTTPAPFTIEHLGHHSFRLRNNRAADVEILEVENRAKFDNLVLPTPVDLDAGDALDFRMIRRGSAKAQPGSLVLELLGADGPTVVPMPVVQYGKPS